MRVLRRGHHRVVTAPLWPAYALLVLAAALTCWQALR